MLTAEDQNIRTLKDFLQFYNNMSEVCFLQCVSTFNGRELERGEETCVERCANKFIRFNHRAIGIYADAQGKLVQQRIKDMETEQEKERAAETRSALLETPLGENSAIDSK